MPIHDPAPIEIFLVEMDDAALVGRRGGDIQEVFLGANAHVGAEALVAGGFGGGERLGESLDAAFAEGGEGGVCVGFGFKGGEEGVLVVGGGHLVWRDGRRVVGCVFANGWKIASASEKNIGNIGTCC